MRRLSIGFACAAMLVLGAAPGLADHASLHDDNDAFGRLDIRTITQGHTTGGRRMLMHQVETYGSWNKSSLKHDGSYIHLLFTTDKDNRPERALVIDLQGGRLTAEMHSWKKSGIGGFVYGHGRVTRSNGRSVRVTFRRALLGSKVTEYGWHVDSQFHQNGHPHCGTERGVVVVCPDSAPNDTHPYAYLRHQL
jgi:hypothetical protein